MRGGGGGGGGNKHFYNEPDEKNSIILVFLICGFSYFNNLNEDNCTFLYFVYRAKDVSILEENKYIVFESQLVSLFKTCTFCLSKRVAVVKVRPKCFGSQLKIEATCQDCDHRQEWYSQPRVGNAMAGNILLSCAILYGGGSPTKILRMLSNVNIKVISVQTFLDHQREYLLPTISRIYHRQQSQLLQQIGEEEPLVLGGDGRHDSPGHCAKYGSYTLMDMTRNKVIDIQLVQVSFQSWRFFSKSYVSHFQKMLTLGIPVRLPLQVFYHEIKFLYVVNY